MNRSVWVNTWGGLFGLLILMAFNNCSANYKFSGGEEQPASLRAEASSGNGTPYGGKLKSGIYTDLHSVVCADSSLENAFLSVEILGDGDVRIDWDLPCSDESISLEEADLVVGNRDEVYYRGGFYFHEDADLFQPEVQVESLCHSPAPSIDSVSLVIKAVESVGLITLHALSEEEPKSLVFLEEEYFVVEQSESMSQFASGSMDLVLYSQPGTSSPLYHQARLIFLLPTNPAEERDVDLICERKVSGLGALKSPAGLTY